MAKQERAQAGRTGAAEVERPRVARIAVETAGGLVGREVGHHLERVVPVHDDELAPALGAAEFAREPAVLRVVEVPAGAARVSGGVQGDEPKPGARRERVVERLST
jgi:hypothetical protein